MLSFQLAIFLPLSFLLIVSFSSASLAASYTVGSTADAADVTPGNGVCFATNGLCTLRAAIQEANANTFSDPDSINLPAGTYILGLTDSNVVGDDSALVGDLDIRSDLTITGAGAETTIIDGGGISRVYDILEGFNVTLTGLTTRNGNAASEGGGAIYNRGTLTLTNCALTGSTANGGGGLENAGGTVTITGCTIADNTSTGGGGGIHSYGTLEVDDSTVSDNEAAGDGGGIQSFSSTLTLSNTTVTHNTAGGVGGGISAEEVELTDCVISENEAGSSQSSGGGGLGVTGLGSMTRCTVTGNNVSGSGGGISASGGSDTDFFTIIETTISNNTASDSGGGITYSSSSGGAFNNDGVLNLARTTVSGNTANAAVGGIDGGGGIHFTSGQLNVSNSTFSGNTGHRGGGLDAFGGFVGLNNVTITDNRCFAVGIFSGNGSGLSVNNGNGASATLNNTLIAGNTCTEGVGPDCMGTVSSGGYNLIQDTSFCTVGGDTTGNITGQDPLLGDLIDNGGLTLTHALLSGSPAIDAGDPGDCTDGTDFLSTDQRGSSFNRTVDGSGEGTARCDIGAYEFEPDAEEEAPTESEGEDAASDGASGCGCRLAHTSVKEPQFPTLTLGVALLAMLRGVLRRLLSDSLPSDDPNGLHTILPPVC